MMTDVEYHVPNWDGDGTPPGYDSRETYAPYSIVTVGGQSWMLACSDPGCSHDVPGTVDKSKHATALPAVGTTVYLYQNHP